MAWNRWPALLLLGSKQQDIPSHTVREGDRSRRIKKTITERKDRRRKEGETGSLQTENREKAQRYERKRQGSIKNRQQITDPFRDGRAGKKTLQGQTGESLTLGTG